MQLSAIQIQSIGGWETVVDELVIPDVWFLICSHARYLQFAHN